MTHATTFLAAAAFLTLPVSAVAVDTDAPSVPKYQVVDLGTLEGGSTWGSAINASGQVTGTSLVDEYIAEPGLLYDDIQRAFIWDGLSMKALPGLGGETTGNALNDSGRVAGWSTGHPEEYRGVAVLWDGSDVKEYEWVRGEAGTGTGFRASFAIAVNASGVVLGNSCDPPDYDCRAFVWDGTTSQFIYGLMSAEGNGDTWAAAINDDGHVVGYYGLGDGNGFIWDGISMRYLDFLPSDINSSGYVVGRYGGPVYSDDGLAVIWDGISMLELGTLGGSRSDALLISDTSYVAGSSTIAGDDAIHAFLWSDGGMKDLGLLGTSYAISAINSFGQITGSIGRILAADSWAFVADHGPIQNLNNLVSQALPDRPVLRQGVDINDAGQILVNGTQPDGQWRAYVLTPISLLIDWLRGEIQGIGLGKKLTSNLETASRHYEAGRLTQTCSQFNRLASGLNDYGAPELVEDVTDIRVAVGCP